MDTSESEQHSHRFENILNAFFFMKPRTLIFLFSKKILTLDSSYV